MFNSYLHCGMSMTIYGYPNLIGCLSACRCADMVEKSATPQVCAPISATGIWRHDES